MFKGLDTVEPITSELVDKLKAEGYSFIIKYCANTPNYPAKRFSHEEAQLLHDAGMKCGFVYEGLSTYASYFSAARGRSDATIAISYFRLLGVPTTCPCFFAVDYDASTADIDGPIMAYAQTFHDTMKANGWLCGVYGSGDVCSALKKAGYVHYTWLSQSPEFSGTPDYTDWDVKQLLGSVDGLNSDPDTSKTLECFW